MSEIPTTPIGQEGKIEFTDIFLDIKNDTPLREYPDKNSQILANLKKGDTIMQLYGVKSFISGYYTNNEVFVPVMTISLTETSKKGFVRIETLGEIPSENLNRHLTNLIKLLVNYDFIKSGLISGTIGFIITLILSFFKYNIRVKLISISTYISIAVTILSYSIYHSGGAIVIWYFIIIPLSYSIGTSIVFTKIFQKIYYKIKGYHY